MSGRILIIDTVATNRIVLKVKMLAAQFSVDACSSRIEAEAIISTNRPDLILINLSDPVEDRHEFCRTLKSDPDTSKIAIIAVGVADTSKARFSALDVGADDVLPHPMNDVLLLARIRSLLRVRNASQELFLRDGTSRALGFEEVNAPFETASHVAMLSHNETFNVNFNVMLRKGLQQPIQELSTNCVLKQTAVTPVPDLFVIDCSHVDLDQPALYHLVSDLRSRNETRLSTQLIIVPDGESEMAAMFLDLGADDVVAAGTSPGELTLRAKALLRRKLWHDRLRDTVRDGLHAAITDPLTALYNRRYVEAHLARLAEESHKSGSQLAVMMMDIDHFKSVNDTYGHAAGDKVLIQLANRLRANLRAIDLVARVGGEEFLVAMPHTNPVVAHGAADRLRRLVNEQPFEIDGDAGTLRVTASVGVATSGQHLAEQRQLTKICAQADTALYAAKNAGRNQVAMSKSAA